MKTFAIHLVLMFVACLKSIAAPAAVQQAYGERFPGIDAPVWVNDRDGDWEARFEKNGVIYRATFDRKGEWKETEHNVTIDQIPKSVRSAFELKYNGQIIREIEMVESGSRGIYYDIELEQQGTNLDVMFDPEGNEIQVADPDVTGEQAAAGGFFQYWVGMEGKSTPLVRSGYVLLYKVLFNLLTIFLYAYVIYYRRHHNHRMMFLLLAFNLFLFPIFLSNSLVTAGFGFTIFALLALVRLRSEAFDKAEIAYLLGAISLTFVNTMLPIYIDIPSAVAILLTAFLADSPHVWRDSYQRIEVDYRIAEKDRMLDHQFLRKKLSDEYQVEVVQIRINRVFKNEVRLTMLYRDLPEIRKAKREANTKKKQAAALRKFQIGE
jgi:hypothetical protein